MANNRGLVSNNPFAIMLEQDGHTALASLFFGNSVHTFRGMSLTRQSNGKWRVVVRVVAAGTQVNSVCFGNGETLDTAFSDASTKIEFADFLVDKFG